MIEDRDQGPCGEVCKTCNIKDECPITIEQWHYWLALDLYDEKSREDASTEARKLYYMQYVDKDNELMDWMDKLLVDCWNETRRDDYHYRYPIPVERLRPFIDSILRQHLSRRERQVITVYLGLDTGEKVSFEKTAELFNMRIHRIREIYSEAMAKLKKAIIKDTRWRRRGPDGRFQPF